MLEVWVLDKFYLTSRLEYDIAENTDFYYFKYLLLAGMK